MILKSLILSILLLSFCANLNAQNVLKGYVLDGLSSNPISYAYIIKTKTKEGTITNDDGYFEIDYLGTDSIEVSYLGYENQTFHIDRLKENNITEIR